MKQVLVVNRSLKLPAGKLAAQTAHAAVGAYLEASRRAQDHWLQEGMPKIVVYAVDADELLHLARVARSRGIPTSVVEDAGRTVVPAGTLTCVGFGPAQDEALDALTGHLKLV